MCANEGRQRHKGELRGGDLTLSLKHTSKRKTEEETAKGEEEEQVEVGEEEAVEVRQGRRKSMKRQGEPGRGGKGKENREMVKKRGQEKEE